MNGSYTLAEIISGLLGIGLTSSFGAWAWVVKRAAETAADQMDRVISELQALREEIHHDRLANERRFVRIESKVGVALGEP